MPLSDEERKQLEALVAKDKEPDQDDFDIEIWDETGAGARVPYRKGKTFLQRFGIDLEPAPDAGKDQSEGTEGKKPGPATRYFGKQTPETKAS